MCIRDSLGPAQKEGDVGEVHVFFHQFRADEAVLVAVFFLVAEHLHHPQALHRQIRQLGGIGQVLGVPGTVEQGHLIVLVALGLSLIHILIRVFERETGCSIRDSIEEIAVASPTTYARYCGHPEGVIYGYETAEWDSLMPRMMMMKEDAQLFPGLRFAGGYAMRSSGYSSAYVSGDLSGRQTVGDLKREVR